MGTGMRQETRVMFRLRFNKKKSQYVRDTNFRQEGREERDIYVDQVLRLGIFIFVPLWKCQAGSWT